MMASLLERDIVNDDSGGGQSNCVRENGGVGGTKRGRGIGNGGEGGGISSTATGTRELEKHLLNRTAVSESGSGQTRMEATLRLGGGVSGLVGGGAAGERFADASG